MAIRVCIRNRKLPGVNACAEGYDSHVICIQTNPIQIKEGERLPGTMGRNVRGKSIATR